MTPTAKLRWVDRKDRVPTTEFPYLSNEITVRILQQWWIRGRVYSGGFDHTAIDGLPGEWRDIEIAREE